MTARQSSPKKAGDVTGTDGVLACSAVAGTRDGELFRPWAMGLTAEQETSGYGISSTPPPLSPALFSVRQAVGTAHPCHCDRLGEGLGHKTCRSLWLTGARLTGSPVVPGFPAPQPRPPEWSEEGHGSEMGADGVGFWALEQGQGRAVTKWAQERTGAGSKRGTVPQALL